MKPDRELTIREGDIDRETLKERETVRQRTLEKGVSHILTAGKTGVRHGEQLKKQVLTKGIHSANHDERDVTAKGCLTT